MDYAKAFSEVSAKKVNLDIVCDEPEYRIVGEVFATYIIVERGDKLLLRSDIFEGKTLPPLVCTVRRVTKRRIGYEYGCEFADLTPATEDMIAKAIMEIQLKRMRRE